MPGFTLRDIDSFSAALIRSRISGSAPGPSALPLDPESPGRRPSRRYAASCFSLLFNGRSAVTRHRVHDPPKQDSDGNFGGVRHDRGALRVGYSPSPKRCPVRSAPSPFSSGRLSDAWIWSPICRMATQPRTHAPRAKTPAWGLVSRVRQERRTSIGVPKGLRGPGGGSVWSRTVRWRPFHGS